MCFDHRYDNVCALLLEQVSILQHLISLADAGSSTDVDTQLRLLALLSLARRDSGDGRLPFSFTG